MSSTSYHSLLSFSKTLKRSPLKYYAHVCKYYMANYPIYFNFVMQRLHLPFQVKGSSKYISSPISSLLILWGMDEMVKRYKKAL